MMTIAKKEEIYECLNKKVHLLECDCAQCLASSLHEEGRDTVLTTFTEGMLWV